MKKRIEQGLVGIAGWFRAYRWLWLLLAVGLFVSWPDRLSDPLWRSIMTNAFATFLVTPVLIFGVDRALRRAEHARLLPRHAAVIEELMSAVAGCIDLGALGNVDLLLPGFIDKAAAGFPRTREVSDANAQYLSRLLVTESHERREELVGRVAQVSLPDFARLLHGAAAAGPDIRARLLEAGTVAPPELYAQTVKLLRSLHRLGRDAELIDHIVAGNYAMTQEPGVILHKSLVDQYAATLATAVALYLDYERQLGRT